MRKQEAKKTDQQPRLSIRLKNKRLPVAFALAVLIHLLVFAPLVWLAFQGKPEERTQATYIDLFNQPLQLKELTPEEQLDKYDPREKLPKGQVVRAPPSADQREPDDARFLAEQNARVEREMQSKIQLPGKAQTPVMVQPATPMMPMAPSPPAPTAAASKTQPATKPSASANLSSKPSITSSLDPLLTPGPQGVVVPPSGAPAPAQAANSGKLSLQPSQQAIAKAIAGSGLDYLEDVIEGDQTALNTRGWEFASFFNRVKSQVEQYWKPDEAYKQQDPYGTVYGAKDRTTVLLVILNGNGSLKDVYVLEPSGAAFLDKEAMDSIRQAAPYPNVPTGLRDKNDNLIKFTFHFIVQMGGNPIFRMRRYQ
jgi:TonB family protein